MINLSIVLITYNRAPLLKKTLETLSQSPFAACELIILNNNSTDDTVDVVNAIKDRFAQCTLITHPFNIGGNANILRAYEYGTQIYKWILCDDDLLDFRVVNDLVEVLDKKEVDLIRISEVGVMESERGSKRTLESLLHDPNSMSFYSIGFIPGMIFRSAKIGANVQYGYKNLHTSYSQLFVLMKSFPIDSQVYTTKKSIVNRGPGVMAIGSEIVLYQMLSLAALPTKKARQIAMSWRRKHQRIHRYVFGYSMLILSDYRMHRKRRVMIDIWWRTVLNSPSLIGKCIIFINAFPIFLPMRLLARLLGKKLSDDMTEVEKRGVF